MAKPSLGTKTPDTDETNALVDEKLGLPEQFVKMFTNPKLSNRRLVIGFVSTDKVELLAGGETKAHYSFRHIEFPAGEFAERGEQLLLDVYTDRTGAVALPGDDTGNQLDLGLGDKSAEQQS
ncbi:MAG: hypothetical protein AB7T06_40790 [Kofleriaceae bacterium]